VIEDLEEDSLIVPRATDPFEQSVLVIQGDISPPIRIARSVSTMSLNVQSNLPHVDVEEVFEILLAYV
jgi:hypothetical protein